MAVTGPEEARLPEVSSAPKESDPAAMS